MAVVKSQVCSKGIIVMKLSIIVPVYKVEEYLKDCVNSILNQTFRDFELILVDDGSPDSCPKICDEYSQKFNNVKVIHKQNGGLSSARNAGMKIATGEYISFIDSDDYLASNMYEHVFSIMEKECADIVVVGRCYVYPNGSKELREKQNVYEVMDGPKATAIMNTSLLGYFDVAAWDKVYKRSLFNDVSYPEGKLSEDWYTTYKVFAKANRIVYDSTPMYYYRQRGGSITHTSSAVNYDAMYASQEVYDFVKKRQPEYTAEANFAYVFSRIGVIDNLTVQPTVDKQKIRKIRNDMKVNIKQLKKTDFFSKLSKKRKIQLFLIEHCLNSYTIIFKRIKSLGISD